MKNIIKKTAFVILFLFSLVSLATKTVAQDKKMEWNRNDTSTSIVMTWNKNTPESEMNDDIKALKEHGVNIKYSNVKRNGANEITAIKVSFSDENGNKGELNLDYKKAINDISIYKIGDDVGFGAPAKSMAFDFAGLDGGEMLKNFKFDDLDGNSKSFSFTFPDKGMIEKKSRIIIKDPKKKELIIEDGKIIEGGDDYTPEELEKIQNEHRLKPNSDLDLFDLRDEEGMKNFKNQFQNLLPKSNAVDELNAAKEELNKAKEELIKAREELERATENSNRSTSKKKVNYKRPY